MSEESITSFDQFDLKKALLTVLDTIGYETPSPIQARTIPLLLEGNDVLGQAQTGTGKTAAFALPILSNLDLKQKDPQVLVLAPTRELAIQVAEAFQKYASKLDGFHVLPIYGGQDYRGQIRALQRGVHVVVGTPGRVMDHMRRGTLSLSSLTALVLDEADEMLRMGFIDDVEWILDQTPPDRQIALFSATMPNQIRRIATKYLNDPHQVTIELKTTTASTIRQRYWPVSGVHKLDALTRILEAETFDGIVLFVRTKTATTELAEKLQARGYAATPINGDIQQNQRERTIQQFKSGKIDILVATDVAARGLDVDRVSHVINYDIPYDTESYVHRIGRTGRAGRSGDAILFVAPREKRLLGAIERATKSKIEMMELPSANLINDKRIEKFNQRISDTLANEDLTFFSGLIEKFEQEHNIPAVEIGAALARMVQGDTPLLLSNKPIKSKPFSSDAGEGRGRKERKPRSNRDEGSRSEGRREDNKRRVFDRELEAGMERFRIEVGHDHEVKPGNIVGAIANEAGLDSKYIGHIKIYDDHSLVDLPEGMPDEVFAQLRGVWVAGQQLNIGKATENGKESAPTRKPRSDKKPRSSQRKPGGAKKFSGKPTGKGPKKTFSRPKSRD
ncbi:MAG: DEAD/DEAH box helicase [Gammaproteobacteria bacterium]|jgi:ATP-dependent RNA helicase DeaD|nr:DEAD/DEAH box helicase [Gammaproteobacteria bacterium]